MERSRHAKLQRRTGGRRPPLSIHFNIISEGPGDFSTQHRKYTCEFSKPGIESFTTTYQCNPRFDGQPTATDVFAALASDALAVDGHHIDDFADELGFEKPSQAIRAYESCRKTLDWLKNGMQLTTSEISDIAETIDNELDEVKEEVERVRAERKAKHEFEHPPVPEGFTSIEDLQSNLDLGEYGDQITDYTGNIGDAFGEIADSEIDIYTHDLLKWLPDNYEWLEEADAQGLLEGCKGNLIKMTQMAQYECFTQDMYNHQEDIAKYAALEGLKEAGVYALADEVYYDVFDGITIDFDDNNMDIEDFATEAQTAIHDAMDEPLYDALGSNDEILEDGELSGDFEAIKESGYDFPNPCAMSVEAVRTVNEKGYEAAFNEFWREFMPEGHELPAVQDVTLIPVTLHFNETPGKSESMTFSAQDTNGLDIDEEVFFCCLTHEELTGMVGKQTGEDFTVESVGEPYQVEAHPKSQEPSQPRLAEKVKETRDGSGKLEPESREASVALSGNDVYGLVGSCWKPAQLSDGIETDVKEDYALALQKARATDWEIEEQEAAEPVSLKAAVKESRAASEALAAHGAPTVDLEHEAEDARKASEALSCTHDDH